MGDECCGSYAIIDRLGAKVQRGKDSKVFVEAHCCASPQRLINLSRKDAEAQSFFLSQIEQI
jgi:hypothetical protein